MICNGYFFVLRKIYSFASIKRMRLMWSRDLKYGKHLILTDGIVGE